MIYYTFLNKGIIQYLKLKEKYKLLKAVIIDFSKCLSFNNNQKGIPLLPLSIQLANFFICMIIAKMATMELVMIVVIISMCSFFHYSKLA